MPIPFIVGGLAALAGAVGIGTSVHGIKKLKQANETIQAAEARHEENLGRFEEKSRSTTEFMDTVGKEELTILESFKRFSDAFEKLKNRPRFEEYSIESVPLPKYDPEKLKEVSHGAGVLLSGLGNAALGTAGGIAAVGAVPGLGLLAGGIIFNFAGSRVKKKADEAWDQMERAEEKIDMICEYMDELTAAATKFLSSLQRVNSVYMRHLDRMERTIYKRKGKWEAFNEREKRITENTVLLVGLLYEMCKVKLVIVTEDEDELNAINYEEIDNTIGRADAFLHEKITDYGGKAIVKNGRLQAKEGILKRFFRWLFSKD